MPTIFYTYSTEASTLELYRLLRLFLLRVLSFCLLVTLVPTTSGRNSLYVILCSMAPTILRVCCKNMILNSQDMALHHRNAYKLLNLSWPANCHTISFISPQPLHCQNNNFIPIYLGWSPMSAWLDPRNYFLYTCTWYIFSSLKIGLVHCGFSLFSSAAILLCSLTNSVWILLSPACSLLLTSPAKNRHSVIIEKQLAGLSGANGSLSSPFNPLCKTFSHF